MISPRSFSASSTMETSNSRCSADLTPISILSKSIKTAILSGLSVFSFAFGAILVRSFLITSRPDTQLLHGGLCRLLSRLPDHRDDGLKRRPRLENRGDSLPLPFTGVFIRDNAADDHLHAGHTLVAQQLEHARHDRIVRAGEDRKADHLHVFLQGGVDNHFRCLSQTSINDFHARVAQRPRNDPGSAVVAVKAGLGYKYPNREAHVVISRSRTTDPACA